MKHPAIKMIEIQMGENKANEIIQQIGKALIELCSDVAIAEIIMQDLEVKEMSLKHCYDSFYEYAKKHKTGNYFGGSSELAEQLICDFYGIHTKPVEQSQPLEQSQPVPTKFSLADFM